VVQRLEHVSLDLARDGEHTTELDALQSAWRDYEEDDIRVSRAISPLIQIVRELEDAIREQPLHSSTSGRVEVSIHRTGGRSFSYIIGRTGIITDP
jgi:hypothetical protein